LKVQPSAKDGVVTPFPFVTPGFVRVLTGKRKDARPRVKVAALAEHLAHMIEALDEVEMGARPEDRPKVGRILDDLNGAYQKASLLCREMSEEASQT
jgi:hypothetical protein